MDVKTYRSLAFAKGLNLVNFTDEQIEVLIGIASVPTDFPEAPEVEDVDVFSGESKAVLMQSADGSVDVTLTLWCKRNGEDFVKPWKCEGGYPKVPDAPGAPEGSGLAHLKDVYSNLDIEINSYDDLCYAWKVLSMVISELGDLGVLYAATKGYPMDRTLAVMKDAVVEAEDDLADAQEALQ